MNKLITVLLAVLLTSAALAGNPTLQGPTGLVAVPSAAVLASDTVDLAIDYAYLPQGYLNASSNVYAGRHAHAIPIRFLWGVAQDFEVGAAYDYINGAQNIDINGKWVTPLNDFDTKVAVGAQYEQFHTGSGRTATDDNFYIVGTRPLFSARGVAFIGDLGLTVDGTDHLLTNGASFVRAMLGVDATITAFRNLNVAIDFIPRDRAITASAKHTVSIVGRMPITPIISVEVGITTASNVLEAGMPAGLVFAGLNFAYATR